MKRIKLIKIILFFIILILFINGNYYFQFKKKNLSHINKVFLKINDINKFKNIFEYFHLFDLKYFFSFKFNIIKIEYKIGFYNNENNFILPSDLILYEKLHLICFIEIINSCNNTNNIIINSLPNIYQNNLYKCTEFYNLNEKIKIGIKIYQNKENEEKIKEFKIYYLDEKTLNYDKINYKYDGLFDLLILNKEYRTLVEKMNDKNLNETLRLKKSYIRYPLCLFKRFILKQENIWKYSNIYNEYFCFCIGLNCKYNYMQKCKKL